MSDASSMLPLLALDVYNRGYGAKINAVVSTALTIGNARFLFDSSVLAGQGFFADRTTGFYAAAYEVNGRIVISFRGTSSETAASLFVDGLSGWGTGAGVSSVQGLQALQFYGIVADRYFPNADPRRADITLTGHSLGGGLAGLVAAVNHRPASIYNWMRFQNAADAVFDGRGDNASPHLIAYKSADPWAPSLSSIYGLSVEGEILQYLRSPISDGVPSKDRLDSHSELGLVELHSMALLVGLNWAAANRRIGWEPAAKYLFDSLHSVRTGRGLPEFNEQRASSDFTLEEVIQAAIAYSAVGSGAGPYGNLALPAFYDDGAELGKTFSTYADRLPLQLNEEVRSAIADLIVEFAGLQAFRAARGDASDPRANGILAFGTDETTPDQSLIINLSDETWNPVGETRHEVVGKQFLVDSFLKSDSSVNADLAELSNWYAGHGTLNGDLKELIDSINLSLTNGKLFVSKTSKKIELAVGGKGNDEVGPSDRPDFLLGLAGNDILFGGKGSDILFGGVGDDTLSGGEDDDWLDGGENIDLLIGGGGDDELRGGGGNDFLYGGKGSDHVRGGAGNDTLSGGDQDGVEDGDADFLEGGQGKDTFYLGVGDTIVRGDYPSLEAGDRVFFKDRLVIGGERETKSQVIRGNYEGGGLTFSYDGKNLIGSVGGGGARARSFTAPSSFMVEDFMNGRGGIRLRNRRPDDEEAEKQRDPLIIDLDGDRKVLTSLQQGSAYFDLDNDGFRERVAWTRAGDGFLALDRNGNGRIDDGSELFGTGRQERDEGTVKSLGKDGFVELALLDDDKDGFITSRDARFGELQVWVDADGDGISAAGELRSLTSLGVVSISLRTQRASTLDEAALGSTATYASSITKSDGSTFKIYDVYLAIDQYDTIENFDGVVDSAVAHLPFLIGSGRVSDLDVAMTRDPALAEMVEAFARLDLSRAGEIQERVQQIVLRWTGADKVAADTRGTNTNARWLAAIEAISGSDFRQAGIGRNPRGDAAAIIRHDWTDLISRTTTALLGQTSLGQQLLPGLRFAGAAFFVVDGGTTLDGVLQAASAAQPDDAAGKLVYWRTILDALDVYAPSLELDADDMQQAVDGSLTAAGIGYTAQELRRAIFVGSSSGLGRDTHAQTIGNNSYSSADLLVATGEDVILDGADGDDRYVVAESVRSVRIDDAQGFNQVRLLGWTSSGFASTVDVNQAGVATITLRQNGREAVFGGLVQADAFSLAVDKIVFDDGELDTVSLLNQFGIIVGGTGDHARVVGTSKDEILVGRGPSDEFELRSGVGRDTIKDTADAGPNDDSLYVDAPLSGVTFRIEGALRKDLRVSLPGGADEVLIVDQFADKNRAVDRFVFSDGLVMSADAVKTMLTTGTGTGETILGTFSGDVIDGAGGSDTLKGGAGDDRYVVRPGYGHTVIEDYQGRTTVDLLDGVTKDDVKLELIDGGGRLTIKRTGETVVVRTDPSNVVVATADGNLDLAATLLEQARLQGTRTDGVITGTFGDDYIEGTEGADLIKGLGGDDGVFGGLGNDTYLFEGGKLRVTDEGFGFDTLLIGKGARLEDVRLAGGQYGTFRVRVNGLDGRVDLPINRDGVSRDEAIEQIAFADGRVIDLSRGSLLTGSDGNDVLFTFGYRDVLTPGAGDDLIFVLEGYSELVLAQGSGSDVLFSRRDTKVTFQGVALDEAVSFERRGLDLVVRTGDDELTVADAFEPLAFRKVSEFVFTGQVMTFDQVVARLTVASEGADLLFGRRLLDGGAGNDVLIGSDRPNDYVFGRGHGHDVIKEQDGIFGNYVGSGVGDTLTLTGLNRSDVTFRRSTDDATSIVMTIIDTGETLTFDGTPFDGYVYSSEDTLGDGYPSGDRYGAHWIDEIIFADGTVTSQRAIEGEIMLSERTDGDDVLTNFGSGDLPGAIMDGGAGNDTYLSSFEGVRVRLSPGNGSDVLRRVGNRRLGVHVSLSGAALSDVLVRYENRDGEAYTILSLRDGTELAIEGRAGGRRDTDISVGVEGATEQDTYVFGEGGLLDGLEGSTGQDYFVGMLDDIGGEGTFLVPRDEVFVGGPGDDVIAGRGGTDTVVFGPGDGNDRLLRQSFRTVTSGGYDLQFTEGLKHEEMEIRWLEDGSLDVELSFFSTGDSIRVSASDLRRATFSDGTILGFNGNSSTIFVGPWSAPTFPPIGDPFVGFGGSLGGSGDLPGFGGPASGPAGNGARAASFYRAPNGGATVAMGSSGEADRLNDSYMDDLDAPSFEPTDWSANVVELTGASSLSDLEFVRDASRPADLFIRNGTTGASMLVVNQFKAEGVYEPTTGWARLSAGVADDVVWSDIDFDRDGVGDLLLLGVDAQGRPDWYGTDLDGDGVSDWKLTISKALDADADGRADVAASDTDGDGRVDTYDLKLRGRFGTMELTLRDLDGDLVPDEYGVFSSWQPIPVRSDGARDWSSVDVDWDGVGDLQFLDFDGDGIPDWSSPDVDGDGSADWVDTSRWQLRAATGEVLAERSIPSMGEDLRLSVNYSIFSQRRLVLRDSDGDGTVDQYGFDNTGDFEADAIDTPRTVGGFLLETVSGDPPEFIGWSVVAPLVTWGVLPPQPPAPVDVDLLALRPGPTEGDDVRTLLVGETIDALGGNDRIYAPYHSNTIVFGRGSGHDVVSGPSERSGFDSAVALSGLTVDDVEFLRSKSRPGDLVIRIKDTAETLTLRDQLTSASAGSSFPFIGTFRFDDGFTLSSNEALGFVVGSSGEGSGEVTTGDGGGLLDGGRGSDLLRGGRGDDVYRFGRDYGEDEIADAGGSDVIEFGPGITLEDVFFSRSGDDGGDLLIEVGGRERLALTVRRQFSDSDARIETLVFDDGRTFDWRQVQARIIVSSQTSGDDRIVGFDQVDNLAGGNGNDTLIGSGGDDVLDGGAGRDVAVYRGSRSEYEVSQANGLTIVHDLVAGRDGTDRLVNVEDVRFAADEAAVALSPVNRAPIAADLRFSAPGGEDLVISRASLLAAVMDPDGDVVRLVDVKAVSHGQAWIDLNGNVRFRPAAGFKGSAALIYEVGDGNGGSATGRISVDVSAENRPPISVNDLATVTVLEDEAIRFEIPASLFADPDGDAVTLTAELVDERPLPYWLTFTDGVFEGRAPADFHGELPVVIVASDGQALSRSGFNLVIEPVNDAPTLVRPLDDASSPEDGIVDILVPIESFEDVDGDTLALTARLASGADLPSWLLFDGERFAGTPPTDFTGQFDIEVMASDGTLAVSDIFRLTVAAVNDAPAVIRPLNDQVYAEDQAVSIVIPDNAFEDVDGDALTYTATLANGDPLPAWLTLTGDRLTGTPPADFHGAFELAVTASDGSASVTDRFRLTFLSVNDGPVVARLIPDVNIDEDTPVDLPIGSDTFTDVDGDVLTLSAKLTDGRSLPTWLAFDGQRFTGTPPADLNGVFEIDVVASDGALTATDAFRLVIRPVNDAPAIGALPTLLGTEDQRFSVTLPANAFSDVDGDVLTIGVTGAGGAALPAWLAFDARTLTLSGQSPQDFNGPVALQLFADDGRARATKAVTLTIGAVNDAPTAEPLTGRVAFGRSVEGQVAASDVDGDTLTYSLAVQPRFGTVALDAASGRFTFTHDGSATSTDSFAVDVSDGRGGTVRATASYTIDAPSNRVPTGITISSAEVDENSAAGILVGILSAIDADSGDTHNFSLDAPSSLFEISGNRLLVKAGAVLDYETSATAGVRVKARDAAGATVVQAFTIAVRDLPEYGRTISGSARNDNLKGTDRADHILGYDGDDKLEGQEGDDLLDGGAGYDTANYKGRREEYSILTGGGALKVRDNDPGKKDKDNDGTDTLISVEKLTFKGNNSVSIASPIILDLDGLGVRTLSAAQSRARFDLDGDGLADETSWIGTTEAFLYLDRNGDGTLTDAGEFSFVNDVPGARSDLDGLRAFDSDGDGLLSESDARFAEFGIWLDADGDGAVDEGETASLADIGLASIELTGTPVESTSELGEVAVLNRGTWTRTDGTKGEFLDAALTFFSAASNPLTMEVSSQSFGGTAKKHRVGAVNGVAVIRPTGNGGVFDPRANAVHGTTIVSFKDKRYGMTTPLVLDLDGDGLEIVEGGKSRARFDMDGNGAADDTGWVGRGDGFLVIDRNDNGRVDNGSELDFFVENPLARTSLEALASLDSNGDGRLDAKDARIGELKVWVDGNDNGVTDAGEIKSLADHGIVSIDLRANALPGEVKLGLNTMLATASFTRANGAIGSVGEAMLSFKPAAAPHTPTASSARASEPLSGSWAELIERRFDDFGGIDPRLLREDFDAFAEYDAGAAADDGQAALTDNHQWSVEVLGDLDATVTSEPTQLGQSWITETIGSLSVGGQRADGEQKATPSDEMKLLETLPDDVADVGSLATVIELDAARLARMTQDMAAFGPHDYDGLGRSVREGVDSYAAFHAA